MDNIYTEKQQIVKILNLTEVNALYYFPPPIKTRLARKQICESWLSDSLTNKEVCVVFNL